MLMIGHELSLMLTHLVTAKECSEVIPRSPLPVSSWTELAMNQKVFLKKFFGKPQ